MNELLYGQVLAFTRNKDNTLTKVDVGFVSVNNLSCMIMFFSSLHSTATAVTDGKR